MNINSPQKDVKNLFEEFEGNHKTLLLELIIQHAKNLKVDTFFDYFQQKQKENQENDGKKKRKEPFQQEEEKNMNE